MPPPSARAPTPIVGSPYSSPSAPSDQPSSGSGFSRGSLIFTVAFIGVAILVIGVIYLRTKRRFRTYNASHHDIEGAVRRVPVAAVGTPPPSFVDAMYDCPPMYDLSRMAPQMDTGSRPSAPRTHRQPRLPPLLRGFTRPDSAVPTSPPSHPPPSYTASQRPAWSRWFSSARSTPPGSPPLEAPARQQLDSSSAVTLVHPPSPLSSSPALFSPQPSSPEAQDHTQEVTPLTMTESVVADARRMLSLSSLLEPPPVAHIPEGLASPPQRQNQSPQVSSTGPNADVEPKAVDEEVVEDDDDDLPLRRSGPVVEINEKQSDGAATA